MPVPAPMMIAIWSFSGIIPYLSCAPLRSALYGISRGDHNKIFSEKIFFS